MDRRSFLNHSAGIGSALAAGPLFAGTSPAQTSRSTRPNILVIVVDDTGWNDVGWHGSEIKTPVMDRLVRGGVELDRFYSHPVCSPTRAAFLTGRPSGRFGIRGPLQYHGDMGLPDNVVTLAEHLRRNGYDTAISGKWHLGMARKHYPDRHGFNHSYGYVGPWIDSWTHDVTDFQGDMRPIEQWHRNGGLIEEEGHVTDLVADEAVRYIGEIRDPEKPFFLYLPFSAPHVPCQEEVDWTAPYEETIVNDSRRYFAAAMTHMDAAIGRVIDSLEKEGIADNTLVVFTSDNGGQRGGEYERWLVPPARYYMSYGATDVLGDNRPLRDWKGSVYEGGIRVPAFMYWPGTLAAGSAYAGPLSVCDLYPTFAHLAQSPIPGDVTIEGANAWPWITGEDEQPDDRVIFIRTNWQASLRKGGWKLIHRGRSLEDGADELYHIDNDPYEENDLVDRRPEILEGLKKEMGRQFEMEI